MNQELLELTEWIDKLKESKKSIIVEGKKDVFALEHLGIDAGRILYLNKPLFELVEDIINNKNNIKNELKYDYEIIILTDLDKKGKELYGKLKKDLCKNGCKIDTYFREFLQKKTKISHIEGLKGYLERLK